MKCATDITGVRCSPHDFRHTFAFNYLANGGDVLKLSRLMGHTDITVTAGYLKAFTARDARRGYVSVLDTLPRMLPSMLPNTTSSRRAR